MPTTLPTSPTSKKAATSIAHATNDLRTKVFNHVATCKNGATCDEIEQQLTMLHQTASARCRELVLMGKLEKRKDSATGKEMQRPTRSGRMASVLYVAENTGETQKYNEADFAWALSKILNTLNNERNLCGLGLSKDESNRILKMRNQAAEVAAGTR